MENEVYVHPYPAPLPVPVPMPIPSGYNVADPNVVAPSPDPTRQQLNIHNGILDNGQTQGLISQGYTQGMILALGQNMQSFPMRIWVVDNSGSMASVDGSRLVQMGNGLDYKIVTCTRWKEIQETVDYHIQLAGLLKARSIFRLLNNPGQPAGQQIFEVAGNGEDHISYEVEIAQSTMMKASPSGVTPLSNHIYDIREQVLNLAPQLNSQGSKVSIVLATDGLPTDASGRGGQQVQNSFIEALRSLEGLPIWIVIRLCTDEDDVVDFYNKIDNQLELSVEVLDNYTSEAAEIYKYNPWINYTLPLHRMREVGFQNRVFDLLDERALLPSEAKEFCVILFGIDRFDGVPDPEENPDKFLTCVKEMMDVEQTSWHPIKKVQAQRLDINKMRKTYGEARTCTIL